jgi:uncharacterized protein with NRDE domain
VCLVLLAWQVHPRYPLVVAANRDEFFARETATADFWPDHPSLLAGRDFSAGGTWMGVTRDGRFAALTNHRNPAAVNESAPSRGALVSAFLSGDENPKHYCDRYADAEGRRYNGFNLLAANRTQLCWVSNVSGETRELPPGIYGLSNELLDTPWPKVAQSKSSLAAALQGLPDERPLFQILRDEKLYPDAMLPRTGVDREWEKLLSAAFVQGPGYGTRGSTVLLIAGDGTVTFDEQTWLAEALPGPRHRFRFSLS